MSNRALQVGGVTLLAGVGYYMYQAGGDPKAAQKRVEADASKLSNTSGKETKKEAEVAGQDIKSEAQKMARDAKANMDGFDAKVGQLSTEAKKELDRVTNKTETTLHSAVDKFDKEATEGAAKAKSGISSWFGGK